MTPSQLLQIGFYVFVVAPVVAAILSFKGPPPLRQASRYVLLVNWLAYGGATLACLYLAFFKQSSGIGNGVFLIIAIPVALIAVIVFGVWKAAIRYGYVQSLPPDLRRVEELVDIERALEAMRTGLASAEKKHASFWTSASERRRLEAEISMMKSSIRSLEEARATHQ
jgi:preprotein translocase subunit SecY